MRQRGTIIKHFTRKKTRLHTLFFDYMFDIKIEKERTSRIQRAGYKPFPKNCK